MLIIPYYLAAVTIAGVAALTAAFTMIGQEILGRRRKRENEANRAISCDSCKHRTERDKLASEFCVKCVTKGFGQGYERKEM